jgi:hypothetical protein
VKKSLIAFVTASLLGLVSIPITSCEDEGPAEKAGKAIDEAAEDMAAGSKEMMEDAEEAWDDTKKAADDAVESAKE